MPANRLPQLKAANHFPDPRFRLHVMRIDRHDISKKPHTHDFEDRKSVV